MSISRRQVLRMGSAATLGFIGLRQFAGCSSEVRPTDPTTLGFGQLRQDRGATLALPAGFEARRFSRAGQTMDDGLLVPTMHDGMATFPGPGGKTLLVRNHEVEHREPDRGPFGRRNERIDRIDRGMLYDAGRAGSPALGGTTTLVYDTKNQKLEKHFLSLAGTLRNCAGGPTPWGAWISCEESQSRILDDPACAKDHGYAFEVKPTTEPKLQKATPLRAMGRFYREAVAIDPSTHIVYQTEDLNDGLLYRFIPKRKGDLSEGRMQALMIADKPGAQLHNWAKMERIEVGTVLPVRWIDMEDVEAPANDLRQRGHAQGAAQFSRGEGIWWGRKSAYIACTEGGPKHVGQVWRYVPSPFEGQAEEAKFPGRLELFIESTSTDLLRYCDNLTVSPWGDVILCEDSGGTFHDRLIGITPGGKLYHIAQNIESKAELAGVCFSPDGSTLFVNEQGGGSTYAITGPWHKRRA